MKSRGRVGRVPIVHFEKGLFPFVLVFFFSPNDKKREKGGWEVREIGIHRIGKGKGKRRTKTHGIKSDDKQKKGMGDLIHNLIN